MNKLNERDERDNKLNERDESDNKLNERDEKYIKHIMSQTNYSDSEARAKLQEFNGDFMQVLKDYMGISIKKDTNKVMSVNQEIYKQIRHSLDQPMKNYREKNPINIEQVITNLQESEEREKEKR